MNMLDKVENVIFSEEDNKPLSLSQILLTALLFIMDGVIIKLCVAFGWMSIHTDNVIFNTLLSVNNYGDSKTLILRYILAIFIILIFKKLNRGGE